MVVVSMLLYMIRHTLSAIVLSLPVHKHNQTQLCRGTLRNIILGPQLRAN